MKMLDADTILPLASACGIAVKILADVRWRCFVNEFFSETEQFWACSSACEWYLTSDSEVVSMPAIACGCPNSYFLHAHP